jgi:primosomal protein N'
MKFKLWLRRQSISAPRMKIKTDLPWPLKIAFIGIVLGLSAAMATWAYDLGRSITGYSQGPTKEELAAFKQQIDQITKERDQFSSTVNAAESQLNIVRSAQQQLAGQVKVLETENASLKEDLAFFESLLPVTSGSNGVAIRRIEAEIIVPNQLRYRLLLMQGAKGQREFAGNLQFAVTVMQSGKSAMILVPDGKSSEVDKFKLNFKHYQRMEGLLTLPEGVSIKAVQVRVLERGQIRAQQTANL